jgi:hypothetical protein
MPNYADGKVYRLRVEGHPEFYVGSTTMSLAKRLHHHNTKRDCASKVLFENHGNKAVVIELLEAYPCASGRELKLKEREWYDRLSTEGRLNLYRPFRSKEDISEQDKTYRSRWREKHPDRALATQKQWEKKRQTREACLHCNAEMRRSSLLRHYRVMHADML